MRNIALIISAKPQYSETFIKEFILGLKASKQINLKVFYGWTFSKWFGFYFLFNLIKSLLFINRIINNFKYLNIFNDNMTFWKAAKITINNLPIITSFTRFHFIHFGFANLAVNNTHLAKHFDAINSLSIRGYDITFYPLNHPGCYKNVWSKIDKIQYNSYDLLEWAYKWGAIKTTPSTFISAAVNNEFILDNPKVKTNKQLNILTVGRFHWKKGLDTALYAVAACVHENIEIKYTLIGSGPELEKIQYLIVALNLEEVVSIKREVTHLEVIDFIDNCDLVIVPSVQEGCSNFVLESQARGKYCIVSNAEGMNQVILNGETGKIVPRGDFIAFQKAIIDFSKYSEEVKYEIGCKAISRIKNDFTRNSQIEKWLKFFES